MILPAVRQSSAMAPLIRIVAAGALFAGLGCFSGQASAQIVQNHRIEDLIGRQVLAVVNFPPRQIGHFMSEVLTLGVPDADGQVMLIGPDRAVPAGGRLY